MAAATAALPATQAVHAALIIHDIGQTIPGGGGTLFIDVDAGGITSTASFSGQDVWFRVQSRLVCCQYSTFYIPPACLSSSTRQVASANGKIALTYLPNFCLEPGSGSGSGSGSWGSPCQCEWPLVAIQFPAGQEVGKGLGFCDGPGGLDVALLRCEAAGEGGAWAPGERAFVGFRFQVNGEDHFGWADVELHPDWSMTVHRVAWQDVAGEPAYTVNPLDCPWDLNGDGIVDHHDLLHLIGSFGPCDGCPEDLNGDGIVNGKDVAELARRFGPCSRLLAERSGPRLASVATLALGAKGVAMLRRGTEARR
ncbi:MAG: hypothetical protein ACYSUF_00210 [Planctomycetota bacterium]|jgi:hypothetical protein